MTEEEADALDELLTRTTPEVDPTVQGPFIKRRNLIRRAHRNGQKEQQKDFVYKEN
jgi:hypothetical protein